MGGPSPPANTTTTTNENPWIGAVPYLTGKGKNPWGQQGIFPAASQFYQDYGNLNSQQQGLNTDYYNTLAQRAGIGGSSNGGASNSGASYYDSMYPSFLQRPDGYERRPGASGGAYGGDASGGQGASGQGQISDVDMIKGVAGGFFGGEFDPRLGFTQGRTAENATGSVPGAYQGMGQLDPTQTLQSLMSGQIDNPYLQSIHQGSINTSLRGYNDALRDAATQIMPGIDSEAFSSGMYGSSRQGVAQGMIGEQLGRNARDLGIAAMDTGNQLYGNAYQIAQGQKENTANLLANQGFGMEQFNVGNQNQTNQFNAGQLQNADQYNANLDLQQQQARAQNALQGVQTLQQGNQLADTTFNQMQSILAAPMAQQQNALNQYANIISPGAAMGGSSSQQIPVYSNTTGQLIGGGATLAGLLASLQ